MRLTTTTDDCSVTLFGVHSVHAHVVFFCADVRVAATVRRGHCGSDQTDVSHASDQSFEAYIPGGL